MVDVKKECPMCGEEFLVWDVKKPQDTCGKKTCVENRKYQKAHENPWTGEKPDPEEINKW